MTLHKSNFKKKTKQIKLRNLNLLKQRKAMWFDVRYNHSKFSMEQFCDQN